MKQKSSSLNMATPLLPFFIFSLFSISASQSTGSLPQPASKSLSIAYIREAGDCNYRVNITTSCSSPFYISSEIGVLFGDAHGNQNGSDDWIPETVEISSPDIDTVKYTYNSSIPNDTWYGFDDCQYFPSPSPPPPPPPSVPSTAGCLPRWKWLASLIPVLFSSFLL
ncbi:embryo-specific protein ATS3A-like isoform X2 [Cucumis melo]|uniref:Embryo-specific protein ATS3A-like isoform X2 n=1 Tax=Cucumis melo TaxID=3656 RepID=A0A1S3AY23_CUCME|nr:embryo-specific protein ATS3A-like isoform X2 [Cucumis melo]